MGFTLENPMSLWSKRFSSVEFRFRFGLFGVVFGLVLFLSCVGDSPTAPDFKPQPDFRKVIQFDCIKEFKNETEIRKYRSGRKFLQKHRTKFDVEGLPSGWYVFDIIAVDSTCLYSDATRCTIFIHDRRTTSKPKDVI